MVDFWKFNGPDFMMINKKELSMNSYLQNIILVCIMKVFVVKTQWCSFHISSFAYFKYWHSKFEMFNLMDSNHDNEKEHREYKLNFVSWIAYVFWLLRWCGRQTIIFVHMLPSIVSFPQIDWRAGIHFI